MVKFEATKEENLLIFKIVDRAEENGMIANGRLSLIMDLESVHCNDIPLDFGKLLVFDAFDFAHDICGIHNNIDRSTGKLDNCFVPRCAKPEEETARINLQDYEIKESLLWWQAQGLQQTATGYGSKLATSKMLRYNNRWHRIYCMCYSNSGTCYILVRGKRIIVD